jgi:hypothetical protein
MKRYIFLLLLLPSLVNAEVYKCQGPGGNIKFQKSPCKDAPDAAPMDLKLPSPAMMERIRSEAIRQQIADNEWRRRKMEEEKHRAEIAAIRAREAASNQLNASILQSRIESAQREARWAHEDYCRNRKRITLFDGC